MRLKDVMNKSVKVIAPGDGLEKAQTLMRVHGIHHLVVVEGSRLVGTLTAENVRRGISEGAKQVSEVVTRQVVTGTPEMTVRKAANLMRGRAIGALPVVDSRRKLEGIVTVSDLLDLIGQGAVRIVERSTRWTLRDRGVKPRSTLSVPTRRT